MPTGEDFSQIHVDEMSTNIVYKLVKIKHGGTSAVIQLLKDLYVKEFQILDQISQSDHVHGGDIDTIGSFKYLCFSIN